MKRITKTKILLALASFLFISYSHGDAQDGKLEIRQLAENVWIHTSYHQFPDVGWFPSNGLIVAEGGDAYLIDTAWSEADTTAILRWLRERGLMLSAVLITHFHEDRSAGLEQLIELGIPTYASAKTNALLKQNQRVAAKNEFTDANFQLLPRKIEVFYPGPGHSEDNHVVWLSASRIVFGGCLLRADDTKDLGNTADASIDAWAESVQAVADRYPRAEMIVPGHGDVGGAEILEHTKSLVQLRKMEDSIEFAN